MEHEMITDKPAWAFGRMVDYGSLDDDAIRHLTPEEIEWNEQLISEEGADSASATIRAASSAAASAAATAPTRGPPATPGAGEQKVARATVLLVLNTTHHPQANPASLSSKPDTDASRHAIPSACACTPRALPPGCFPSRRRGLPPLHGLKQHTVETQQRGRTRPRTEPRSSRRQGLPTLHLRLPRHGENAPGCISRGSCKGFHGPPASTERTTTASPRVAPAAPHSDSGGRPSRQGRAISPGARGGRAGSGCCNSSISDPRQRCPPIGDRQVQERRPAAS